MRSKFTVGKANKHYFCQVIKININNEMSVKVRVNQSWLILSNPIDYTVHGILQARILEWVAIHFFRGSYWPRVRLGSPALQVYSLPTNLWGKAPCGSAGKEYACNVGDLGLIPGLGRFPGEGEGYPLQYSGLEISMGSQRVRYNWDVRFIVNTLQMLWLY